jgi:ABC-type multidrug transport system permease subunit
MHPTTLKGRIAPAGETRMLWTVFAILLLLWLLGWGFHIAGSLIHLILVIALVVLLVEVITGRRAAV